MIGVDWGDPQTFWLNVMNASLGILCAAAILAVLGAAVLESFRSRGHRHG